jgi:uncharacterized protein YgiM (DUF1202 family)
MSANTLRQILRGAAIATAAATLAVSSIAAEYVSITREAVHMRAGPGTQYSSMWRLPKGYPLRVQKHQGRWVKVIDVEKDSGWVYAPLTAKRPRYIVQSTIANVRSGPGTGYRKVGQASFGEIVRPLSRKGNWVKVSRSQGSNGWISRKLLWGW